MSSLYDDASLIMYPSGYKADKIYSLKPTDGSGDLDFTRAGTATRVNESGLIESVASGVPRIDYTGGGCGKLLLEPQRTNLVTYSEQFNNAAWTKFATSISANSTISPDGTQNADTLIADGSNSDRGLLSSGVASLTIGTSYSTSIFAKANTNNFIQIVGSGAAYLGTTYANFDLANGTIGSYGANVTPKIEDFGNGWYRCTMTATTTNDTATNTYIIGLITSATSPRGELNTLSTSVYIYGAEIEEGSYPTSYIPTLSAASTRGADSCSKTGISSLIGQTEGTMFVEVTLQNIVDNKTLLRMGISYSHILQVIGQRVYAESWIGGANQAEIFTTAFSEGDKVKIGYAYKANDYVLYVNGVQIGIDTSASVPSSVDILYVGNLSGTQQHSVEQALIFKTRLTNAQLAKLTTL